MQEMVKNPPAVQETQVGSLGQEDPLEEEMAAHSSILAWRIPWMEEPGGLQSTGSQRVGHDLNSHLLPICFAYGNKHVSARLSQFFPPSPSLAVASRRLVLMNLLAGQE